MVRRPPSSTLFPSRRSSDLRGAAEQLIAQAQRELRARGVGALQPDVRALPAAQLDPCREHGPQAEDRKSTRLNSSHLGISYAVFCLKKKTIITESRATSDMS